MTFCFVPLCCLPSVCVGGGGSLDKHLTGVPDDLNTQDAFPRPLVPNMVQTGNWSAREGQVDVHKQKQGRQGLGR